jgi:hypothetical protein
MAKDLESFRIPEERRYLSGKTLEELREIFRLEIGSVPPVTDGNMHERQYKETLIRWILVHKFGRSE